MALRNIIGRRARIARENLLWRKIESVIITFVNLIRVQDLEQNPAAVLARVEAGERLLLTRNDQVVAELRPAPKLPEKRRPMGLAKGEFDVPDDFDSPLPLSVLADFE
jgi:antitoxin (DNA-binding transcriptional repressor) of toxin-antitoxin stability system